MMGDKPNPTSPGIHNHLGPKTAPNPFIEGCPIEDGHGANPIEVQLADHLARIKSVDGDGALLKKYEKLASAQGFDFNALTSRLLDMGVLTAELVALRLRQPAGQRH
jgi:hypothetical protein